MIKYSLFQFIQAYETTCLYFTTLETVHSYLIKTIKFYSKRCENVHINDFNNKTIKDDFIGRRYGHMDFMINKSSNPYWYPYTQAQFSTPIYMYYYHPKILYFVVDQSSLLLLMLWIPLYATCQWFSNN